MDADDYTIRYARSDEFNALPAIERAAAALFRVTAFPYLAAAALASEGIAPHHDRVWVAVAPTGQLVGFAIAHPLDGSAYLHELDVDSAHGRRGLGRRLIDAVAEWARQEGLQAITLTTFRAVPWNAPYYARLGFRPLGDDHLSPGLRAVQQAEAEMGLPIGDRLCMRLDLTPGPHAKE